MKGWPRNPILEAGEEGGEKRPPVLEAQSALIVSEGGRNPKRLSSTGIAVPLRPMCCILQWTSHQEALLKLKERWFPGFRAALPFLCCWKVD